jgi:hypothetical protein
MEETFKLEINAVSPNGEAINCKTNIKVECNQGMAVGIICNLLKQEPRIKSIIVEAMLLSIVDENVTQPISSDEFLDSILEAKEKSKQTEL